MRVKAEKVVDPESIAWIEQREDSRSDEGYFESAWLRALSEAALDLERRGRREAGGAAIDPASLGPVASECSGSSGRGRGRLVRYSRGTANWCRWEILSRIRGCVRC